MQRGNVMQQLTEKADLPMEPIPGLPVVEIAGDNRVLIENHCGMSECGCDTILVKVRFGKVRVYGQKLELANMSAHQLIIRGNICGVELMRGG